VHRKSKTLIYRKWASMKNRCNNPNEPCFKYYGGRGIKLCDAWQDFRNFYDDMGDCPPGMDRIDVNGPYSKANCRWVSRTVNANNRRNNRKLAFADVEQNIGQWAGQLGVTHGAIVHRIKTGRSPEEVFSPEKLKWDMPSHWRHITAFGKTLPLKEWCKLTEIKRTTITERIRKGSSPEAALSKNVNNARGLS